MTTPTTRVLKSGNTTKADPFTVCFIANPSLESPEGSRHFIADPILSSQSDFDDCVDYAVDCLFGDLPGQQERLLDPLDIRHAVRVVSLFTPGLPAVDANGLVAEQDPGLGELISCRRTVVRPFLARFGLDADIVFAISASTTHTHATAWDTTDDNSRSGVPFVLDGVTLYHRHHAVVPGTIALHVTDRDVTPLHEFQHAMGSYTNGQIADLYHPHGYALNKRQGRPIPVDFSTYEGTAYPSDPSRDGIGYSTGWTSYHCELHFPSAPALMDNYYLAPPPLSPLDCENDRITRAFLHDRLRAKINR